MEYVIPGNDDALRSIKVVMDTLAEAVAEGNNVAARKQAKAAEATVPEGIPEKDGEE